MPENNNINPETFWNIFSDYLHININKIREESKLKELYSSGKRWSEFMISTLKKFGQELGYTREGEIGCEFYRIDVGYYKYSESDNELKDYEIYDWDFDIAIEHENTPIDWLYEFTKLVHINCGLKVIIGYHNYRKNDTPLEKVIKIAEKLYAKRRYKSLNENWLIIIGPFSIENDRDFCAFKIVNGKFAKLEDKKVLKQ